MGRIPRGTEIEGGYKSPSIHHLWGHHRKMARLVVSGATPGDLASLMGFSKGQISRILGSPLFQAEVRRLESSAEEIATDINRDLQQLAGPALENLEDDVFMEVGNLSERKTRQAASLAVLDRAGYPKKETPSSITINQTKVDIQSMSVEQLQDEVFAQIDADVEGG